VKIFVLRAGGAGEWFWFASFHFSVFSSRVLMALIKPFAALRPSPRLAEKICELPYDVMSSEEARAMAADNPLSFLHVSKPEIDLPPGADVHGAQVYAKGRENFDRLIRQGALREDPRPCFYFYRQIMGAHSQTGLVAAASCEDYLQGVIKKHELTHPDKEDDRVRHIESLDSQTGPVFLVYRANKVMDELTAEQTAQAPDIDFTASDGVRHSSWRLCDEEHIDLVRRTVAGVPSLYIADGHHRAAAAARVYQARHGAGESAFFLSVIFPDNQLQILPYNRVLKDLNGLSAAELLKKLELVFTQPQDRLQELRESVLFIENGARIPALGKPVGARAFPHAKHEIGLLLENKWRKLLFRPELCAVENPLEGLDVTLLQKHVLAPVFGIDNPRTSQRIEFIGGIRGTDELEKRVNSGEFACAFSMFPTNMEDLMRIADAGGMMPPKSTWFEPKLRDGMFCHLI
jgi:uncharacterized protein (DUF1015 family)